MPRRMFVSLYLWFLLALVLTLASAAGVFGLTSGQDWEEQAAGRIAVHSRLAAELLEALLDQPDGEAELARLLQPALVQDRAALSISDADGSPLSFARSLTV